MKIIISEDQYRKIFFTRRLGKMLDVVSMVMDDPEEIYSDINFCKYYPTFDRFVKSVVSDIMDHYDYDDDNTEFYLRDFIYDDVGIDEFVRLVMVDYGERITRYYKQKTKDC